MIFEIDFFKGAKWAKKQFQKWIFLGEKVGKL